MKVPMPAAPKSGQTISGSDTAPIVYFDGVIACGLHNGIVQLELAANELIPIDGKDSVRTKVVVTAHIRCSPAAAMQLNHMIEQALSFARPVTKDN